MQKSRLKIGNISKVILDALYDGVLIIDADSIVRYVNPSYTRITGVSYEEIVSKPLLEVRPGAKLQRVLKTGERILRARRLEDGVEYVVNMVPVKDDGEIIGGISLVKAIDDAVELTKTIRHYKKEIASMRNRFNSIQRAKYTFDSIICADAASLDTKALAKRIAKKNVSVLITGESGTGKELFAQAIHNASDRNEGPFIAVNCAAINPTLLESELFGYIDGAFTGAVKGGKAGLFEAADQGTIFLDEISEMEYSLQSKLLRTLQESTIRRVGAIEEKPIDVRVIVASNKNLEEMVDQGTFREDFYYRLAVFPLDLLPLRERRQDIFPIARMFLSRKEDEIQRRIDVSNEAIKALESYDWPGNIRELRNAVEFAYNMMPESVITLEQLPVKIRSQFIRRENVTVEIEKLSDVAKRAEKKAIYETIQVYGDSIEGKKKAAKALGISLATLYNKIKSDEKQ
jgi:PAS domain S-box-containing protein